MHSVYKSCIVEKIFSAPSTSYLHTSFNKPLRDKESGMLHYIAYHNRQRMQLFSSPYELYTNKNPKDLTGSTVWGIEGIGKSHKDFYLVHTFMVKEVRASPHPEFKIAAYGDPQNGYEFSPHIHLNEFEWFQDLKKKMGNFGFGLQRLKAAVYINELSMLAYGQGFIYK